MPVTRRRTATIRLVLLTAVLGLGRHTAFAQAPAPPPPPPPPDPGLWEGTAGAGLALTSGNSDTLTFNLAFDATRDPKTRNVFKMKGLFLRSSEDGDLVTNRLSFTFRDQYALTDRTFVFGQFDYLRDTFKQIDYLIAPTGGIGYKLVDSPRTKFAVDAGVGAVWEKNPGLDVDASFAISAGEKLEHQITPAATLKHGITALWKADDFADGLYTFSVGLGTKISERFALTCDLLDTYKNKPPTPETKKNDVALVTAITAKF
jgi:putative salt-induced outer membrane protein YdiY